jgi:hypothetical protein
VPYFCMRCIHLNLNESTTITIKRLIKMKQIITPKNLFQPSKYFYQQRNRYIKKSIDPLTDAFFCFFHNSSNYEIAARTTVDLFKNEYS